jgi:DNA-binding response OmpR family regulator
VAPRPVILYCGGANRQPPDLLVRWAASRGMDVEVHPDPVAVEAMLLRGRGTMVFIDDGSASDEVIQVVARIKNDPLTAIIPVTVNAWDHDVRRIEAWYLAGADEILSPMFSPAEQRARLGALQIRTERSIGVHPSTRLPGTIEIDRAIRRQLESGSPFAVCYADLDHFKESTTDTPIMMATG